MQTNTQLLDSILCGYKMRKTITCTSIATDCLQHQKKHRPTLEPTLDMSPEELLEESVNALAISENRPSGAKSNVWNSFRPYQHGRTDYAVCLLCKLEGKTNWEAEIKYANKPDKLNKHVTAKHREAHEKNIDDGASGTTHYQLRSLISPVLKLMSPSSLKTNVAFRATPTSTTTTGYSSRTSSANASTFLQFATSSTTTRWKAVTTR